MSVVNWGRGALGGGGEAAVDSRMGKEGGWKP